MHELRTAIRPFPVAAFLQCAEIFPWLISPWDYFEKGLLLNEAHYVHCRASTNASIANIASRHHPAWKRPWVHGEPLDDEHPCYLPMPYELLTAITPNPDLMPGDKKLFTVLLAVSWSRLDPAQSLSQQPVFRALARRLRQKSFRNIFL